MNEVNARTSGAGMGGPLRRRARGLGL